MEYSLMATFSNPTLLYYLETFLTIRGLQNHLSLWAELKYLQMKENISGSNATFEDTELIYKKYINNPHFPLNDIKFENHVTEFFTSKDPIDKKIELLLKLTLEQLDDRLFIFYENYENKKIEIKLNNLLIETNNDKYNLKGGSVKDILDFLIIHPESSTNNHWFYFLSTYRKFITTQELIIRINHIETQGMDKFNSWLKNDQIDFAKVRLSFLECLKTWLNPMFKDDFRQFTSEEVTVYEELVKKIIKYSPENEHACKGILEDLKTRENEMKLDDEENSPFVEDDHLTFEEYCSIADKTFFDPMHDKTMVTNENLIYQDPNVIAEQLTLIDTVLFSQVRVRDILELVGAVPTFTTKKEKIIKRITKRWDQVVLWVVTLVLESKQPLEVVKFFVLVARRLKELKNFHSLMQIQTALEHNSMYRLQLTKKLAKVHREEYQGFKDLFYPIPNHSNYRTALKQAHEQPEPYIFAMPILQRDLTNSNEMTDYLDNKKKYVNFDKMKTIGKLIHSIEEIRSRFSKYGLKKEKEGCGYLLRITHLDNDNEESYYEASLKAEKTMQNKPVESAPVLPTESSTVSFKNPLKDLALKKASLRFGTLSEMRTSKVVPSSVPEILSKNSEETFSESSESDRHSTNFFSSDIKFGSGFLTSSSEKVPTNDEDEIELFLNCTLYEKSKNYSNPTPYPHPVKVKLSLDWKRVVYVLQCTFTSGTIESVKFNPPEGVTKYEKMHIIQYEAIWDDCRTYRSKENSLDLHVFIYDIEKDVREDTPSTFIKNKNNVYVTFNMGFVKKEEQFPILKFDKKLKEYVSKNFKKMKFHYFKAVKTMNPLHKATSKKVVENEAVYVKTKKDWEEVYKLGQENLELELFVTNEK